ncbi:uncharacterized protein LOC112129078 [Pongo abelii]|uniref:uncharacterized protein LOC112129078 n=1 Tax=Pongo abelii TaxID=9601 RepID=UPI0023E8676D|nr:uncharacterized protein LOC112129078 [Pongo abelii]
MKPEAARGAAAADRRAGAWTSSAGPAGLPHPPSGAFKSLPGRRGRKCSGEPEEALPASTPRAPRPRSRLLSEVPRGHRAPGLTWACFPGAGAWGSPCLPRVSAVLSVKWEPHSGGEFFTAARVTASAPSAPATLAGPGRLGCGRGRRGGAGRGRRSPGFVPVLALERARPRACRVPGPRGCHAWPLPPENQAEREHLLNLKARETKHPKAHQPLKCSDRSKSSALGCRESASLPPAPSLLLVGTCGRAGCENETRFPREGGRGDRLFRPLHVQSDPLGALAAGGPPSPAAAQPQTGHSSRLP